MPLPSCIWVTGATSGFGKATAERLVREGARVIASGRRVERLEALKAELGEKLHTLVLDVCDRDAVNKAIASLPAPFNKIDALVNNAGLALGLEPLDSKPYDDIERMIETNIYGLIHCTQSVLPLMAKAGKGHVVNIGSMAGNYPYPGANVYGASKAFVKQLSLNMRADLLGKNIRVTNIEPGLAQSEFSLVRFHGDQQKADSVYENVQPLTPEDIAESVCWCLSQPAHVNVNRIELMPVSQAFGALPIHRGKFENCD